MDETLSQVCSTNENESKSIIHDEISTEESVSWRVQKSINENKYAKNEEEHEENLVTDNPVVKETIYFNIFECGKNILNRIEATCKWACMENSSDKYYNELLRTITYCNDCNYVPLSNEKIREVMHKVITEEE